MMKDSITYEGQSIIELKADFENAIDSYLEGCEELGIKPRKAYSRTLEYLLISIARLNEKQTGVNSNEDKYK